MVRLLTEEEKLEEEIFNTYVISVANVKKGKQCAPVCRLVFAACSYVCPPSLFLCSLCFALLIKKSKGFFSLFCFGLKI